MYAIHLGIPEMETLWSGLKLKSNSGALAKDEAQLYRRWGLRPHGSLQSVTERRKDVRILFAVWRWLKALDSFSEGFLFADRQTN